MTRSLKANGFTLIELMITVLVAAILVLIAYPSYQEHLKKGRRAAAQSFLIDLASRQQQHLVDARSYAVGSNALATLSVTVPPEVAPFYTIRVDPAANTTPPQFTIAATPVETSSQKGDGVLTISETGARTRNGVPGW